MEDVISLVTLTGLVIGVASFLFRDLYKSNIRKKYRFLSLRSKSQFNKMTIDDCISNQENYNVLSSFFYKVQLIDTFIKRFVPPIIVICMVSFILMGKSEFNSTVDKELNDGDFALGNFSTKKVELSGSFEDALVDSHLIYKSSDGKVYMMPISEDLNFLTFSEGDIQAYAGVHFFIFVIMMILMLVLLAHFVFQNLETKFSDEINKNVSFWKDELTHIDNEISRVTDLLDLTCKEERLRNLKEKSIFIKSHIEQICAKFPD